MSFYASNDRPGVFPGIIQNCNANGVCERVCIQVKKVFDACLNQITLSNLEVLATDFDPPAPVEPLTYVSAVSNGPAVISNLSVIRLDDQPNFARVSCSITMPIKINYIDANSVPGTATSTITLNEDVLLYVPQTSVIPYSVEVFANGISNIGSYIGNDVFQITICIYVILKIVAEVDLLVPSYGYCPIPPCTPFDESECNAFFNLPLFPVAVAPQQNT